jgi:DNA repair exonuclease SbcCD nuclease subunit
MRIISFTDPHITEESIKELESFVFPEILSYVDSNSVVICLGDYYHRSRVSPKELTFGTKWIYNFSRNSSRTVMIRGNHPTISDEHTSVDYLNYLSNTIVEDEYVLDNMFFGHFMTEDSEKTGRLYLEEAPILFPEYEKYLKDIEHYKLSLLGHQHSWQLLKEHIYHLGSCRYVSFGESQDKEKYIAIIENDKLHFIPLTSVIKMKDVKSIDELKDMDSNTKVRIIYDSFNQFKLDVNKLIDYKDRFVEFKTKLKFVEEQRETKKSALNIKEWLDSLDEEIKEILQDTFREHSDEEI